MSSSSHPRRRGALVGVASLAALAVTGIVQASPASAVPGNPYSPQVGHSYRHGVIPTRATQAKMNSYAKAHPAVTTATGPQTLSYGGGIDGIGVTSGHSKTYLVFYGSQWGTSSTDANGNLQFSGDANGAAVCPASGASYIPYQSGGVLAGVWYDNSVASPSSATGHQLGQEAVNAAAHFGNTTAASNRYAYYVILSPHGTNPDNYQGAYCAWHDYNGDSTLTGGAVSSPYGDIAFSNQPYNIDSGAGCGVGFVNSPGTLDGWTMTLGHEWHEMMSDQNPAGGWTNHTGSSYNGQENSDECAWISPSSAGGAANVSFGSFGTYAEQASWSNDTNNCAISHAIVNHGGGGSTNIAVAGAGHWSRWNNGDHSALVTQPPAGAVFEGSLGELLRVQVAGTAALYSCYAGTDEFTSPASNCEGARYNGLLGFIYTSPPSGVITQGVYRCLPASGDHFDSLDPNCEGYPSEGLLGYTIAQKALSRWNNGDHSALVRQPPAGAVYESSLGDLLSVQVAGTAALYSCYAGTDEFTSPASNCEVQRVNGLLGFIYTSPPSGVITQGVYRCLPASGDHFDSLDPNCEGYHVESLLGYTIAQVALSRWNNGDHSALVTQPPAGAVYEASLGELLRVQVAGTVALYSCYAGTDEFTSPASNCEGARVNGLLGFIYTSPPSGVITQGVYRCLPASGDHFDSLDPNCEGYHSEGLLGYTIAQD